MQNFDEAYSLGLQPLLHGSTHEAQQQQQQQQQTDSFRRLQPLFAGLRLLLIFRPDLDGALLLRGLSAGQPRAGGGGIQVGKCSKLTPKSSFKCCYFFKRSPMDLPRFPSPLSVSSAAAAAAAAAAASASGVLFPYLRSAAASGGGAAAGEGGGDSSLPASAAAEATKTASNTGKNEKLNKLCRRIIRKVGFFSSQAFSTTSTVGCRA